jgi:hypothetical protein
MIAIDNGGDGNKYFTVRKVLKIGGKKHVPSICYEVTGDIVETVNSLVSQGLADIRSEKVRFISGKPVSAQAASTIEEPRIVVPEPVVATAGDTNIPLTESSSDSADTGEFAETKA